MLARVIRNGNKFSIQLRKLFRWVDYQEMEYNRPGEPGTVLFDYVYDARQHLDNMRKAKKKPKTICYERI